MNSTSLPEKNSENILAEIMMLKSADIKYCILVEGNFDLLFWRSQVTSEESVVYCNGKKNLKAAIKENNHKNYINAIGIQDRDFNDYYKEATIKNLIYTDYNDIETTLLCYGGLEKIMAHLIDKKRVVYPKSSCEYPILEHALFFGKLRIIDKIHKYKLRFNDIPIMKYYKSQTFIFSKRDALKEIAALTNKPIKEIVTQYKKIEILKFWNSVRGHDCLSVLSRAIKCFKANRIASVKLETALLLAFDKNKLRDGDMCKALKKWGNMNCIPIFKPL